MDEMIFHIMDRAEWDAVRKRERFSADSLESEGFIHCSFARQTEGVIQRFFPNRPNLVILEIDPARVSAEIRVEDTHGHGDGFPHVYGMIETAAVRKARPVVD